MPSLSNVFVWVLIAFPIYLLIYGKLPSYLTLA